MAPPIPKAPRGAVIDRLRHVIAEAHCIPVLVRLGVFDALDGRRHVDQLAAKTGTNAEALARVLAFCECAGLVGHEGRDGWYEPTELGRMLMREDPESCTGDAAVRGARRYIERWDGLEAILRGAERTAAEIDLDVLDRSHVAAVHCTVLADCAAAFSRSETYVDVESGDPALLAAVLQKSGRSEGIFVGKAPDLERAKAILSEARVAQRCELRLPQDTLPPGDAIIVSHRLEAVSDEAAVALLSRAAAAMKPNGRVLIIGRALKNQYQRLDHVGAAADLEMLLLTQAGKLRSVEEIHLLCTRASLAPKPVALVGALRTLSGDKHTAQVIQATRAAQEA